jgi:alkanesulfonate monooxygenase SsuD/methylene tetrahydromethanopterin reductase-like flavin-dependent oxidoreductase (luciferase family)
MQVGMQLVFQNHTGYADADMFRTETKLAIEAEAMGFDFVGLVEHHFTDYAMCPDNAAALAFIAAKTKKLKLMPAAFILPWNDPLRVAEKAALLDILSEGRVILGFGRGLAKCEFDGFRVDMNETRERFDESAEIILKGLETGFVEADTKHYRQPRVEIRPRPPGSFQGRSYMVGMSPSSVEVAARLGLGCLKFSQGSWKTAVLEVRKYRDSFRKHHNREAPPIIIADMVCCFEDKRKTEEYARKYMAAYYDSVLTHYEMAGDHFKKIPAYSNYAAASDALNTGGVDKALEEYLAANMAFTPSEMLDKLEERREIVGDYDLAMNFTFGSMPYEDVWHQAKLFADKVLPKLKSPRAVGSAAVA